jgi:hypothetical protein
MQRGWRRELDLAWRVIRVGTSFDVSVRWPVAYRTDQQTVSRLMLRREVLTEVLVAELDELADVCAGTADRPVSPEAIRRLVNAIADHLEFGAARR